MIHFYNTYLVPTTLLNSLISSRKFFGNSFGNFYVDSHVLCNKNDFISSFLICMLLFHVLTLFHWLDLPVLYGIRGYLCLVPNLKRKALNPSPLSILAVGFSFFFFVNAPYQVEEIPLCSYCSESFCNE